MDLVTYNWEQGQVEDFKLFTQELVFNDQQVHVAGYEHLNDVGATCMICGQVVRALLEILWVFDEFSNDVTRAELGQQVIEVVDSYHGPVLVTCEIPKRITVRTVFAALTPPSSN